MNLINRKMKVLCKLFISNQLRVDLLFMVGHNNNGKRRERSQVEQSNTGTEKSDTKETKSFKIQPERATWPRRT